VILRHLTSQWVLDARVNRFNPCGCGWAFERAQLFAFEIADLARTLRGSGQGGAAPVQNQVQAWAGRRQSSPALECLALGTLTEFERVRVVLVATRNPLNIGAVARAMSNFGFFRLYLVNPFEPSFREAKSAVGAAELMANAQVFATVGEAVADCTLVVGTTAVGKREIRQPLKFLEEGGRAIYKHLRARQPSKLRSADGEKDAGAQKKNEVAILFGSEKFGLANEDLSHCNWLLRIPTRDEHRSMNLGQAVAICLYELARDAKRAVAVEKGNPATAGDIDRVADLLLDALRLAGSMDSRSEVTTGQKLRRLMRRHNLTAEDAKFWLGMFGQITYKLRQGKL
jgi:TrmH family RNA methyltransferase